MEEALGEELGQGRAPRGLGQGRAPRGLAYLIDLACGRGSGRGSGSGSGSAAAAVDTASGSAAEGCVGLILYGGRISQTVLNKNRL